MLLEKRLEIFEGLFKLGQIVRTGTSLRSVHSSNSTYLSRDWNAYVSAKDDF